MWTSYKVFDLWYDAEYFLVTFVLKLTLFESMRSLKALQAFPFVIAWAGFDSPLIHLISVIIRRSYDWRGHIRSTINLFSWVLPNLTRRSYSDFESVQRTRGSSSCKIFSIIALITAPWSKPWAILYSSEASTERTLLHLMEDQCMIFALLSLSARTITKPICEVLSLLLANEASVNTTSLSDYRSSSNKLPASCLIVNLPFVGIW